MSRVNAPTETEPPMPFPNRLRAYRDALQIPRERLSRLCDKLVKQDEIMYVTVAAATIRELEKGQHRPQAMTARTLAAALGVPSAAIFPALAPFGDSRRGDVTKS